MTHILIQDGKPVEVVHLIARRIDNSVTIERYDSIRELWYRTEVYGGNVLEQPKLQLIEVKEAPLTSNPVLG